MKRTDPKLLVDIINESLRRDGLSGQFNEQRAAYLWGEVTGPGINRYTTRRYVDHGVLHVYLSSAALKQELAFARASIIAAINNAIGSEVLTGIVIH